MAHVPPPGLPEWTKEDPRVTYVDSTWDVLAEAIVRDSVYSWGNDARMRWLRYCLLHWHCGQPMRLGVVEYKDKRVTFGWQRSGLKTRACRVCGFFEDCL